MLAEGVASPSRLVVLVVALTAALLAWRRFDNGLRLVLLFSGISLAATALHPYKEPRFLLISLPTVFLSGGFGLAFALEAGRTQATRALGALASWFLFVWLLLTPHMLRPNDVAALYPSYSASQDFELLAGEIGRIAPPTGRLAVLGTFNQLSPALVEWVLRSRSRSHSLEVVNPMPRQKESALALVREQRDAWLRKQSVNQVVAIKSTGASPWFHDRDFQLFNFWQLSVIDSFSEDPEWQVVERRQVPALGVELQLLQRKTRCWLSKSPALVRHHGGGRDARR